MNTQRHNTMPLT